MNTFVFRTMMSCVGMIVAAMLCSVPVIASAQTTVKYVHTDALGSVVAMTDSSGNTVEARREYEPYGYQSTPAIQDGPGYTGHVQDAATGLTYMQQRYYDPGIGIFLSVDPVTAYSDPIGQFHRYRYANNNPYKFKDPDGRYNCVGSATDCGKVDQYVSKVKESQKSPNLTKSESRAVQKLVKHIGPKGKGGPTFTPSKLEGKKMASTDQRGNIKIDVNKTMPGADNVTSGAVSISHEVDHDMTAVADGEAHTREAATASERSAYGMEEIVARGLGISISQSEIEAGIKGSVEAVFGPEPDKEE
ncbi:RHS repeat domain-containing protein [Luteimonas terricola]|uniref:Teneurin-like YD-shell domain-containing protein n=1 Tax=Luteimonas terricola TaxID=645597 RepID=A0ABQ2EAR0_9GAMM|nr:RHS repeat-associated core domain-containing protein [Luteimonas terricola]GGK03224.1 hypothetical protein GCM10011394_10370 [Luteimonas terricola]